MTCMVASLDAVLVAVRDHGQEARALDGGVELALVDRAGAGQARRDDLAVLGDEVAQGVDVLVVDFLDAGDGEAAEALALEQQRLGVALRTLVLVEFLERGHVCASLRCLKRLAVEQGVLAVAGCRKKAGEGLGAADRLAQELFPPAADPPRFARRLPLPALPRLEDL